VIVFGDYTESVDHIWLSLGCNSFGSFRRALIVQLKRTD
jgi:hypothetical protein